MLRYEYMPDQEYATPWKHLADTWVRFVDGNHPSPFNLSVYERFTLETIVGSKDPQVLLLGATAEIRDMLAEHKHVSVILLDINQEMVDAMSSFMTQKSHNESVVIGDWLHPPFEDSTFDVVLGDHVRSNVADADQDTFYKNLSRILKPDGCHVTRLIAQFEHTSIQTPEELIDTYSKIPPTEQSVSAFLNRFLFFSHRGPNSPTDRFFALLEQYFDKPHIKQYYTALEEMLPRGKTWNVGRGWEHHKKVIERYFEIEDKVQCDTSFKDASYVFKLRKI